ncbi:MAG: gamma-glutamyltransferase [Rhodospirillaceae bacterium]|nr:gamma-glutamyltransferase [Rhodospirillaceae bacterium]
MSRAYESRDDNAARMNRACAITVIKLQPMRRRARNISRRHRVVSLGHARHRHRTLHTECIQCLCRGNGCVLGTAGKNSAERIECVATGCIQTRVVDLFVAETACEIRQNFGWRLGGLGVIGSDLHGPSPFQRRSIGFAAQKSRDHNSREASIVTLLFHHRWDLKKPAVRGPNGVVSSQHYIAAEIGAEVLRAGGNAVDAAIATSFAISVVEPWMSGLGGGGYMQIALADSNRYRTLHFGMRSPAKLDPADYPLAKGDAMSGDLFAWPSVVEDRNIIGYPSIAVPGQVAGIALAHERYATMPWSELLQPAIDLAKQGLPITWNMSLRCLGAAKELKRFPASKAVYLDDHDLPLQPAQGKDLPLSPLGNLPGTLERLADAGPEDFYKGDLAEALVEDLQEGGNKMEAADLAAYEARETDSLPIPYRNIIVHAAPDMTAGPTMARVIELAGDAAPENGAPDTATFVQWADALDKAYQERLDTMGDSAEQDGCTTHLTVADKNGNLVSLTQTLLSVFGSRVTLPRTGLLMNNGIYWFDPRPGGPNSLAPGKKALSNMCPAIVEQNGKPYFAIGASGGRRIMPAVFQVLSMIGVSGMSLDNAAHQPRIDVCGEGRCTVDPALGSEVRDAIAELMPVFDGEHTVYPHLYACPNVALADPATGDFTGFTHVMTPPSATVAA